MRDADENEFRLTREVILSGALRDYIRANAPDVPILSDEELEASWRETLAARPGGSAARGGDVWVFGYGSLIWNPAIRFVERRIARLYGYHRRFCLWTHLGRGTPERPGLMLGLEPGGSCVGMAFRIAAEAADEEIEVVWRREMFGGAYRARWCRVATAGGPVDAIAFLIDPAHPRYADRPPEAEMVDALAHAAGPLGTTRAYLDNTLAHLAEYGIRDRPLARLQRLAARAAEDA
ncbi:MAG: gamma-glutamylcyclotransferase [Rhodospirillaceae bacterium]|nr:gamma-glutamylcyclotransferase [Rhodospirillaceae bacterium]